MFDLVELKTIQHRIALGFHFPFLIKSTIAICTQLKAEDALFGIDQDTFFVLANKIIYLLLFFLLSGLFPCLFLG